MLAAANSDSGSNRGNSSYADRQKTTMLKENDDEKWLFTSQHSR